ncbi:hypothetical protein LshimejAT787_0806320 [Lyophyllum shimeji]|uniref:C2H2-type domain-containing protein n=1 Tax=Lyophyllum shimeji TaxID=47721 RepID=A0A9P3PS72_LYOSH|nr:hypothetical protein LshimejAT787_0806320 [Lyophyllum shimeji]
MPTPHKIQYVVMHWDWLALSDLPCCRPEHPPKPHRTSDTRVSSSTPFQEDADMYPMSSIERIERTFCTNFSCCNVLFPDLHALLDHYDATSAHSICPTPHTPRSLEPPSPSSSPPSSPDSQHHPDSSPPPPLPPPAHLVSQWQGNGCADADVSPSALLYVYQPDAYALSEYPTYEHCYRAATATAPAPPHQLSTTALLHARADADADAYEHAPLSSVPSSPSPSPSLPHRRHTATSGWRARTETETGLGLDLDDAAPTLLTSTRKPGHTDGRHREKAHDVAGASASGCGKANGQGKRRGKGELDGVPPAAARRRSRKAYHCPTPGCTKSYLNPNGLKYHQEKGTCKIEPAAASPAVSWSPAYTRASTSTSTSQDRDDAAPSGVASEVLPLPSAVPVYRQSPNSYPHEHIHHPRPRQVHRDRDSVDALEQLSMERGSVLGTRSG